jgi:nicotinamide-nucleotide amidase
MKVGSLTSAEIVAVGTEMLLGSLVDTNTAWLSRRLAASGIAVHRHTAIGDDGARLVAALSEAAARADLVLSTGGLGPTFDDLTNEALGRAMGREMVEYSEAKHHVERAFRGFTGREPPPSAYKQALFPEGSELVANPLSTAMGALLELDGVLFATLPGVPAEMRRMFEETLEPMISEEELGEEIGDLLGSSDPALTPLVGPGEVGRGQVHIRLTTKAPTREGANRKIGPVAEERRRRLGEYYLGTKPA